MMRRKKTIIIIIFILALFYWFMVNPTPELDRWQSYGLFRYDRFGRTFCTNGVAIEPKMFAYKYGFPYFYCYGVSGYSKVNIMFFGKVEKVINEEYDVTRPDDLFGNMTTSIKRLKEKYGDRLILKKTLQDVSKEDLAVYKKLELKGEKNKTSFFASMMIDCPMYKQIEECLDKL